MQIQKGWIQIEPIQKSNFDKSFIVGKATQVREVGVLPSGKPVLEMKNIYFSGQPVLADDKYFIKEEQVIAYE
jgi:hypothetical protein